MLACFNKAVLHHGDAWPENGASADEAAAAQDDGAYKEEQISAAFQLAAALGRDDMGDERRAVPNDHAVAYLEEISMMR